MELFRPLLSTSRTDHLRNEVGEELGEVFSLLSRHKNFRRVTGLGTKKLQDRIKKWPDHESWKALVALFLRGHPVVLGLRKQVIVFIITVKHNSEISHLDYRMSLLDIYIILHVSAVKRPSSGLGNSYITIQ